MRILHALLAAALAASPAPSYADSTPPNQATSAGARLVPVVKDDVYVGLKVYAIESGSRFDQAGFENGDMIEKIGGEPVTTAKGIEALNNNVIRGAADATIDVVRKGAHIQLVSKANH